MTGPDRAAWLQERLGATKSELAAEASRRGRASAESDRLQELYVRLARTTTHLSQMAHDAASVLAVEEAQIRPLLEDIRAHARRGHLTIARPIWRPAASVRDPSFVVVSGSPHLHAQLVRVARDLRIAVGQLSYPGLEHADARWLDLSAATVGVFDVGSDDPQVFYELGIAMGLGIELLLLATEEATVPFDVAQQPVLYAGAGPSDERLASALDEALYRPPTATSSRSSVASTVAVARRLAHDSGDAMAGIIVDQAEHAGGDPLGVRAALTALGVALGDDRLTLLHPRWPSAAPDPDERRCFAVMPFRDDRLSTFRHVAEICHTLDLLPVRGDQAPGQEIIASIWEEIGHARCVLVDLTGLNANVCLELGLADVLGRPTFLLGAPGSATEDRLFPAIYKRRVHVYDSSGQLDNRSFDEALRRFLEEPEGRMGRARRQPAPPDHVQQPELAPSPMPVEERKAVTVNGVRLEAESIQMLERTYRTRLVSGNYWYDAASGLWGVWGGPAFGQIQPGLALGGPLALDASGGQTNVVINGRAIHPLEYQVLVATFGYAIPGRYRLDGWGNVGVEGGPFLFNIHLAAVTQGGRGWYHSGPGGTITSDGTTIGYTGPDGESLVFGG